MDASDTLHLSVFRHDVFGKSNAPHATFAGMESDATHHLIATGADCRVPVGAGPDAPGMDGDEAIRSPTPILAGTAARRVLVDAAVRQVLTGLRALELLAADHPTASSTGR
jgi:hypothetical protein